jgi:hypothetical protein
MGRFGCCLSQDVGPRVNRKCYLREVTLITVGQWKNILPDGMTNDGTIKVKTTRSRLR